jgi:hypothetical protein
VIREREQLFALGMGLGMVVGLGIGCLLALRVSDESIDLLRRLFDRLTRHEQHVEFEALLQ